MRTHNFQTTTNKDTTSSNILKLSILVSLLLILISTFTFFGCSTQPAVPQSATSINNESSTDTTEDLNNTDASHVATSDSGIEYIDNQIILYFVTDTPEEAKDALFSSFGDVNIDDSMADIDIYLITYNDRKTYEELDAICTELEENEIVESAYPNYVSQITEDTEQIE